MADNVPPALADWAQRFQAQMDASVAAFDKQMQTSMAAFLNNTNLPPTPPPPASSDDWALVARILSDPILKAKVMALVADYGKQPAAPAPG